jgi:HK97 family phage major capsid protein
MSRKVPVKMTAKLNDALVAGTGVGMPMGILNAACLVTQAAEGSQTADTINFLNIVKMYSRMESHSRRNAVWIMNQDIEPQLASLVIPAASGVSSPAYLPAGSGLTQAPNGTLMGRPIFFTEAASALGDVGDIIFADMKQYCTVQKSSGMKADSSIHLWFDQGVVAFRFILRIGGAPYWASSITTPHGNTRSCFVTLASR